MTVYGYCRVSTAEQANGGLSLETQQQQITGYAMMKGWQIAEFFTERGVSGSVSLADRFQGQRMLAVLQTGDVVITAKLDRAFRSAANALDGSPFVRWSAPQTSSNARRMTSIVSA